MDPEIFFFLKNPEILIGGGKIIYLNNFI